MRGSARTERARARKKGAVIPSLVTPGLKVRYGTWLTLVRARQQGRRWRVHAEAAARLYCSIGTLLQESSSDRRHEEGVTQEDAESAATGGRCYYYYLVSTGTDGKVTESEYPSGT